MGIQRMCACRVGLRGGEYGGCIKEGTIGCVFIEGEQWGTRIRGEQWGRSVIVVDKGKL